MLAHCAVCVRSRLGAQAAFDKGHYRVHTFGGIFNSAVVKEAKTRLHVSVSGSVRLVCNDYNIIASDAVDV